MHQINTPIQPGDIVVIVPRWIIGSVGALMLLIGLSISFALLFAGLITESILFTLAVLILVPVNLIVCYVVWRLYWYLLLVGLMLQILCLCTAVTGFTGLIEQMFVGVRGTPLDSFASVITRMHMLNVIFAILLSSLVVGVIVMFYRLFVGAPQRRMTYHYGDPYDIDEESFRPRLKRSGPRDLWKED